MEYAIQVWGELEFTSKWLSAAETLAETWPLPDCDIIDMSTGEVMIQFKGGEVVYRAGHTKFNNSKG